MDTTPIFTQFNTPLIYDNSIETTVIVKIPCDKTSVQQLNQANTKFKFHYTYNYLYLVYSPDTGFIIRSRLHT